MSVRSTTATGNGPAPSTHAAGMPGPGRSDADVAERVDALIAQMTVAEKAGQLTQYFYFDLPPSGEHKDLDLPGAAPAGRQTSTRRWPEGRSARCCSSLTRRRSTGCSGWP